MNRISLDEAYLQMAEVWSGRAYATRAKVGALLVGAKPNDGIIADGYNGMPSGFPNEEIEYKMLDGSLATNKLGLHAESNAILKCGPEERVGATLYCTYSPCFECSKLIIQSKIKRVVFRQYYRDESALPELKRAGIELVHIPRVDQPTQISEEQLNRLREFRARIIPVDNLVSWYGVMMCVFGFSAYYADASLHPWMLGTSIVTGTVVIISYLLRFHLKTWRKHALKETDSSADV